MNVEDIARRASEELRDVVGAESSAALAEFRSLALRRQRQRAATVTGAVVALVLVGAGAWQWSSRSPETVAPADQENSTLTSIVPSPITGTDCGHERISCLGGDRYRVYGDVEMTWSLPAGFDAPYSEPGPTGSFVESSLRSANAGLAVFHHVGAAAPVAQPHRIDGVDMAREFVDWVAERPFVIASAVEPARVGDRLGWTVEVSVPESSPAGPALCHNRYPCHPVVYWSEGDVGKSAGVWPGMTARYTALDLHNSGISVIWSWSADGRMPAAVERVAETIRFE